MNLVLMLVLILILKNFFHIVVVFRFEEIKMKKQKIKDIKNRYFYKKIEILRIKSKLIKQWKGKNFLIKLEKNKIIDFQTKIANKCIISNRKNSIHRKFRISRIVLRNIVINGLIIGLKNPNFS
jgi:ribosomal protein S14